MSAKAVNAFCRKNFTAFKHRIIPAYEGVRHLNFLDKYLMEVARFLETGSGIRRLIVETPPRHGKSLTISEAFPAWLLGRNPHLNVIIASYAASLAELHSRIARGFVQDQTFGEVFPNFKLSEDNQRVDEWGTQDTDGRKGGLVAVGFGGTVVGKGSHCLIIDDPHKGRDEAESKDQREKTWNAYTNDFLTRANNSNQFAQIVVAQRYHDDDLIGRLLREQEGEWVHVRLPALAEENDMLGRAYGEALWPERFPVAALENRRQVMGDYPFASQYQQRPIPKGEQVFEVDKIEVVTRVPAGLLGVRFYDLAITAKAKSDYTVGLKMAIDPANEDIYVLDVFRQKTKPAALLAAIKSHAFKDGKEWDVALEGEKAGIMNIDYLSRDKDLRGFKLHLDPIKGDKYARAQAVMSRVALGQVKILRAAWNRAFIEELRIFDSGAHDDQVDALSGAYNFLAEQVVPEASIVRAGSWYGDEAMIRQVNQPSPDFWS